MAKTPRPHQQELIDFFFNSPYIGTLAWHGMGLGKTLSTLWIARRHLAMLRSSGVQNPKFLIICPKSAVVTWKTECLKETPDLYRDMLVIPYSQLHKAKARIPYVDIRFIAFDESHALKSPETERIKNLEGFLRALATSNTKFEKGRLLDLTGTPMPNTASEFYTTWAKCAAHDLETACDRLLDIKRFSEWRSAFSKVKEKAWSTGRGEKKKSHKAISFEGVNNEELLYQLISPITHYKRVSDCIDLPPIQTIPIDLGLEDDKLLKDADIEKPEAYMAVLERLARAKMPYMHDWVKDFIHNSQEQLVVFSMYTFPLYELKAKFKKDVVLITGDESRAERDANLKAFQDGNKRVIAMSYACGSESLNLQNAFISLYHGYPWNWAKLSQAFARTYRTGQKNKTLHYILTSGANDSNIFDKVMMKKEATEIVESLLLGETLEKKPIFSVDDFI